MAGKKHQAVNSFNLPEVVGIRRGVASELGATGPTKSDSVLMMGSYYPSIFFSFNNFHPYPNSSPICPSSWHPFQCHSPVGGANAHVASPSVPGVQLEESLFFSVQRFHILSYIILAQDGYT